MVTATLEDITRQAAEKTSKALSTLLNKEVSIEFHKIGVKAVEDLCPLLAPEEIVAAVVMPITGDAKGAALLVVPEETVLSMADALTGGRGVSHRRLTEFGESAVKEAGNIVAGAYLSVVSNTVGTELIEHVPDFAYDMFGAVVSQIVTKFAESADHVLVVEVEFRFSPARLNGYFLLIFNKADSDAIFGAMEGA